LAIEMCGEFMSDSKALVPQAERFVDFYGDRINLLLLEETAYVPLKPIADFLGLAWSSQRQRTMRDNVMSKRVKNLPVTAADGSQREMLCLPLDLLPGWLFGISVSRVKESLQEKLDRYREECFQVLWEAFQEGRLTADPNLEEILQTDTPAVQTYKMLQAMAQMARNQVLLEARLSGRLAEHEDRLERIEAELAYPERTITPEQAANLSQAIKAIAMELSNRSGRNEYGGVYGELYRRFKIPAYRELPARRYQEAMDWLKEWWQSLTDDTIPF
jgi:hypothetical protein